MSRKSYRQAINEAIREEMRRDPRVILVGEDVAGGAGGSGSNDAWGGPMATSKGLIGEFGPQRVIDTPISETAILGMAAGAALTGLRPIVDLSFLDFFAVAFDQVLNQMAKFRYIFGGKSRTPLVVRAMYGAGYRAGAQHSQALYPILTHIPGLKVVLPSSPYDVKGLLIQAIRDDDPVFFLEHKTFYDMKEEVPDESYTIPFGKANVRSEGKDVTIVALGKMVHVAGQAVASLKKAGVEATLIDPRTTSPLDEDAILKSVEATGRLVVVDEASPRCGLAGDIAAMVCERAFAALRAPIRRVTPPHTPVPFSPTLEDAYLPSAAKVEAAVHEVLDFGTASHSQEAKQVSSIY
jgi:pyruvate dehydrogenase E1 component beta subunit